MGLAWATHWVLVQVTVQVLAWVTAKWDFPYKSGQKKAHGWLISTQLLLVFVSC
jgi:hypothetical protein